MWISQEVVRIHHKSHPLCKSSVVEKMNTRQCELCWPHLFYNVHVHVCHTICDARVQCTHVHYVQYMKLHVYGTLAKLVVKEENPDPDPIFTTPKQYKHVNE